MDALTSNRVNVCLNHNTLARFFSAMRQHLVHLWPALMLCVASNTALAAQQGPAGSSSTGSLDIFYTQGINVRVNGFADMPLGTWSGSGPLTANDNICVARTGAGFFGGGIYRILASGDGEPGNPSAFTLSNGVNQISYNAYFNDSAGTGGRVQLTPGVVLTNQTASGISLFFNIIFGCVFQNANLSIEVPESELSGAAGNYAGTLTVLMMPE